MHLDNQHLKTIQTTKRYYKNKYETETNTEKKRIYKEMINDLTEVENEILNRLLSTVELSLGGDMPLFITFNFTDGLLSFMLAPRLDLEEE